MQAESVELLDPRIDVVFKLLLQDEPEVLASLIASVVDLPGPLQDVKVLNPIRVGEVPDDKNVVLDVLAQVPGLGRVNIEMQRTHQSSVRERFLYYWAREYGTQLARGEDYVTLAPVISILWFDFVLDHQTPYHSVYTLQEVASRRPYSAHLQIHTLELPKLTTDVAPQTLRNWSYFFAGGSSERAHVAKRDTMIERAMEKLQKLSEDDMVRRYAERRERDELALRNEVANSRAEARKEALQQGRQEGREEGREEGRREVLARLLVARFGTLPESAQTRLDQAEPSALMRIEQGIFTATSLDELFGIGDLRT